MALTRLNNRSITAVTALPSGIDIPAGTIVSADLPSGSVVQVAKAYDTSTTVYSPGSGYQFVRVGLTASITPKFSNSKIAIIATVNAMNNGNRSMGQIRRYAGGSEVVAGDYTTVSGYSWNIPDFYTNGSNDLLKHMTVTLIDSPNTTSAIEYRTYLSSDSTVTWYYNRTAPSSTWGHMSSTMLLLEILS